MMPWHGLITSKLGYSNFRASMPLVGVVGLTPVGHSAHHRTDLVIHGPKKAGAQDHIPSQGCIVLLAETRLRFGHGHDRTLEVIE